MTRWGDWAWHIKLTENEKAFFHSFDFSLLDLFFVLPLVCYLMLVLCAIYFGRCGRRRRYTGLSFLQFSSSLFYLVVFSFFFTFAFVIYLNIKAPSVSLYPLIVLFFIFDFYFLENLLTRSLTVDKGKRKNKRNRKHRQTHTQTSPNCFHFLVLIQFFFLKKKFSRI